MASKFLDDNGLLYFWQKITSKFVKTETGKGLSTNDFTTAEKEKLATIAENANDYSLPTASTTVKGGIIVGSGLTMTGDVLSATADTTVTWEDIENKPLGQQNGVATLDSAGKVPSAQLPSYVDDVIEGYYNNGKFYEDEAFFTEITGEQGKIYIDLLENKSYRYSGSIYVEIISMDLSPIQNTEIDEIVNS